MSGSLVADLEKHLSILLASKPPGSQRPQVEAITQLSENNVEQESVIVTTLVRHCKKCPPTHKLGGIYIFDSVLRRWMERARQNNSLEVRSPNEHGTYAAGIARIRDVIGPVVQDVIQSCPEDQREKVKRLLTIWERSSALPMDQIQKFRSNLDQVIENNRSTTPIGTPPVHVQNGFPQQPAPPPVPAPYAASNTQSSVAPSVDSASILQRLAAIAQSAAATTSAPASTTILAAPQTPAGYDPRIAPASAAASLPVQAPPSTAPPSAPPNPYATPAYTHAAVPATPPAFPVTFPGFPMENGNGAVPQAAYGAAPPAPSTAGAPAVSVAPLQIPGMTNLAALLQTLAAANPNLAQQLTAAQTAYGAPPTQPYGAAPAPPTGPAPYMSVAPSRDAPRDYPEYDRDRERDYGRVRNGQSPYRGRSRSPTSRTMSRDDDFFGNGSIPTGPAQQRNEERERFRERSPTGTQRGRDRPKWIGFDGTLLPGHIKVLSRTLFVGGVNYSEAELTNIFSRFGTVQSCIVNQDKRHAFVKMLYRDDAVRAIEEMKAPSSSSEFGLRTRWGVGFGPRDCSNYETGISVIPIASLTDADIKWMHTAKYGGCGDRPIDTGLCVEEPDIEIGAGVSSKAISRRIPTDRGGFHGYRGRGRGGGRGGREDRRRLDQYY